MKTNLKKNYLILGLLAGLILITGCAVTQQVATSDTPKEDTSWMFHDQVDADFVKAHIAIPMPEKVMLIDARPYRGKYVKGHIPGAVSIPFSEFDKKVSLLPEDKETLLIYYCEGPTCKLSHQSARKAEELGYKNVKVYTEGFPEWVSLKGNYASISIEQVEKQIEENNTLIVDARPQKGKFEKGHIPTAINLPFTYFDTLKGKLPRDLETPIIFYCEGLECTLSHKSALKALEMGYKNVTVFSEGYPEWVKVHGKSGEMVAVKAGEVEGSIDLELFKGILADKPESIMIIDVRDVDEFAKGSFKTAVNIPVEQLEAKIKDLPDDKPIVYVCPTGARSGEAFYMTKDVRPSLKEVYYVEAVIDFKDPENIKITAPKK